MTRVKEFKTYEELLAILKNDRCILINESDEDLVKKIGYSNLISPFKDFFCDGLDRNRKRIYSIPVSIHKYFSLYQNDCFISDSLSAYIGFFEKQIKRFISDKVCESFKSKYCLTCDDYTFIEIMKDGSSCDLNCFEPISRTFDNNGGVVMATEYRTEQRNRAIDSIIALSNATGNSKASIYVADYFAKHNTVPFWILINSLSLSTLYFVFDILNNPLKKEFISYVLGKTTIYDNEINSFMLHFEMIYRMRNIVHHHGSIIPFLVSNDHGRAEDKKQSVRILKQFFDTCSGLHFTKPRFVEIDIVETNYNKKRIKRLNSILDLLKK